MCTSAMPSDLHPIGGEPREYRQDMIRNGYDLVRLGANSKIPQDARWQLKDITPEEAAGWSNDSNTGIRATRTPAIDVDILDPEGARVARSTLYSAPERYGENH